MKLPWRRWKEIEREKNRLEERVEELEQELERLEQRFDAESERRKKMAREKQEAEEELNRLRDRIRSFEDEEPVETDTGGEPESIGFDRALRLIRKLGSIESPGEGLVTVYCPGRVEEVEDFKGLKNSVPEDDMSEMRGKESFIGFMDPDFHTLLLRTRPFFDGFWTLGNSFEVGEALEFISEDKTWVTVSAGETTVFREQGGEYEELERISSRVDRQHGKGGFSQDRFERKRSEQVENHLEEVEESLEGYSNVYLLGDRRLCQELPGEHLGGFDPNKPKPEAFYGFQLIR